MTLSSQFLARKGVQLVTCSHRCLCDPGARWVSSCEEHEEPCDPELGLGCLSDITLIEEHSDSENSQSPDFSGIFLSGSVSNLNDL